jgi:DNA replication and repair protein RecF
LHIHSLYLRHFRNYPEAYLEFSPGLNCLYGENAQGKTNLLEAIHFLMTGRSFRTTHLVDLIFRGESAFYVEAVFYKHGIEQQLKVSYDGKKHAIVYNSTLYPSPSHLLGLLQGVLLSPEDNELVKGSPAIRRQFLDLQLAQAEPLYLHHLNRYYRAMKQRNHLLRAKSERTIESWEHEMAYSAAYLLKRRTGLVTDLNAKTPAFQTLFSAGLESLSLEYKTTLPQRLNEEEQRLAFIQQAKHHRTREMFLGYTLSGPHKDDLLIHIDGQEAKLFASEGQQRCSVAALKFSQWEDLSEKTGEMPLMLIDDIGISLDSNRKARLFGHLASLGQVFITTPDFPPPLQDSSFKEFHIRNGSLA